MKNTVKRAAATAVAVFTLLSAGALATSAVGAAEIGNAPITTQNDVPILRNGVWQAVGTDGTSEYIEVHNSVNKIDISSAENKIGVGCEFDYDWSTGVYTIEAGCIYNVEHWQIYGNDGSTATMTTDTGKGYSLFFLGTGNTKNYKSLVELRDMSKNYYEKKHGDSEDLKFTSQLRPNGSGLADIRVIQQACGRSYVIETYTIDVKTGVGTDTAHNVIDFTYFA